jgi:hypothetical protein
MSAALPPCGGVHGAQGVVAGGLWVRCGSTVGRNLLAAAAYITRVTPAAKIFDLAAVLILANISKADECRTGAKFRGRILLIPLRLREHTSASLLQPGKLFPGGTVEVQIRKAAKSARQPRRLAEFHGLGLFRRVFFQIAVQAGPANSQDLRGAQAIPLAHIQNAPDVYLAHLLERQRTPLVTLRGSRPAMLQAGKSARSMKSPPAVILALEITFSSSRTFPGQECCSRDACARRVKPEMLFPYASLYFFRKNCTSSGMSSSRSVSEGRRSWIEHSR